MSKSIRPSAELKLCALFTAASVALLAVPAQAQTVDELTVTGHLGNLPEISQVVSYADLDLTTSAGEDAFKSRIKATAKDLCRQLGEGVASSTPLIPSCEAEAYTKAMPQVRQAVASATPRAVMAAAPTPDVPPMAESTTVNPSPVDAAATVPAPVFTVTTVTNGPVPDTQENRRKYGSPMSNAGRRTAPQGN